MYVSIQIGRYFNDKTIGIVCYFLSVLSPFLYVNSLKKKFKKGATFDFYEESFSVTLFNLKTEAALKTDEYRYNQIESLKIIRGATGQYSGLIFRILGGNKKRYTIDESERNATEYGNGESIYNLISFYRDKKT